MKHYFFLSFFLSAHCSAVNVPINRHPRIYTSYVSVFLLTSSIWEWGSHGHHLNMLLLLVLSTMMSRMCYLSQAMKGLC